MVSQWTKMADERTRVSSAKLVIPKSLFEDIAVDTDISAPCYYSLGDQVMRDVGCQVILCSYWLTLSNTEL